MKKRLKKVTIITSVLLILGICYYFFVKYTGIRIPCIFYTYTNLLCPGCGITRMFMAIGSFDFKLAFAYNPIIFSLLPLFIYLGIKIMIRYIKTGSMKLSTYENIILIIICIIMILFGIYRNLEALL